MSKPLTEEQLYAFKLHGRVMFLEVLARRLLQTLAHSQPKPDEWLQAWAKEVEESTAPLKFPTMPAAVSDMLAAEYQESVALFLKELLRKDDPE